MKSNTAIYEFFLDNIQKVMIPEDMIEIGLSLSRFEILTLLVTEKYEAITMSHLAQRIAVPMSTATGIADRLVKKGLLKRGSLPEDRRVVTVSLTNNGNDLVKKVQERFQFVLDKVRTLITEEEFAAILTTTQKIIAGFQNERPNIDNKVTQPRKNIEIQ